MPETVDPFATDTADPARVFAEMFPAQRPRPDWRLFSVPEALPQLAARYSGPRVAALAQGREQQYLRSLVLARRPWKDAA